MLNEFEDFVTSFAIGFEVRIKVEPQFDLIVIT